jgi:hypothetical protein
MGARMHGRANLSLSLTMFEVAAGRGRQSFSGVPLVDAGPVSKLVAEGAD